MAADFRPSRLATLITVPAVAVMVGLGVWQLQRLEWKESLLARVQERIHAPPVPLPAAVDDPGAIDLRPVTVAGVLLDSRSQKVPARPRQGRAGYEIITPLVRAQGAPVLVNRGWVPLDDRSAPGPDRPVTWRGVARMPGSAGWVHIPDLVAAAGIGAALPVVVEVLPGQEPPGAPAGIEPRADLPNNHFQYALTWFGLAATLAVIYVLSQRRPREPS